MPEHSADDSSTRARFAAELVGFVNETLPGIHSSIRSPLNVDIHTPLFESGLIDSLAILHLIAFVERQTGRTVPPRLVVMKHFRTIDAICECFGPSST